MEYVIVYLLYVVVSWLAIATFYPRNASVRGWQALVLIPAVLPVALIGVLVGTHHFVGSKSWGLLIELK